MLSRMEQFCWLGGLNFPRVLSEQGYEQKAAGALVHYPQLSLTFGEFYQTASSASNDT